MSVGRQIDHAWIGLRRAAGGRSRVVYRSLAAWLDAQQYRLARRRPGHAFVFQFLAGMTATLVFCLLGACLWLASQWLRTPSPLWKVMGGALTALTVWLAYPRLLAPPPEAVQVDAATFPTLYHLVGALAILTQTQPPIIVLTEQFGVAFGRIGWRRRPVLLLGHPLLLILEPHELVAVISHELTHDRDGAATRSLYLLLALNIAAQWQLRLAPWAPPPPTHKRGQHRRGQALNVLSWVWRPAYWLASGLYGALQFCMARDAQQAEYAVDAQAISVAGGLDMAALMRKFLYGHALRVWPAYTHAPPACKPAALACAVRRTPESTIEALWAEALTRPRTLTEWHPPLAYRLAALERLAPIRPKIQLSPVQVKGLRQELQHWPVVIHQRAAYWLSAAAPPQPEPASIAEGRRQAEAMSAP